MFLKRQQKKDAREKLAWENRCKAFFEEYIPLTKKHNLDFASFLVNDSRGIIPIVKLVDVTEKEEKKA